MRRLITTASLLLVFSSLAIAAPIYKWVDAQGVTHFGSEPPSDRPAESVSTNSFQPPLPEKSAAQLAKEAEQQSSKTQAQIDREVRKQIAEETAALKKYCENVRHNLAQLENNPRVLAEIDGKPTRLSEEERQARIAEMKQVILERCTNIQ
ncbi:DUF4124 domain-containing protein [Pseudomonas sp. C27(2019)]|uniref:DUF4124 domain-containing protein n=1 Tax=Pseudomonas sp. C27(2019) TaxID=2604941 RepID=UPI0012490C3A|nr:DUF4124 domain-containing protein [Pseudomonas sp. C27(2019)]QEY57962.1 DUF4124 domain-containing protein [Pseudomonas sp. C27(2019)]